MGKRQKVAATGRPSDGVDDGEDYSSSDLSSDELSDCDDPPYVLPRAAATGKAKATAQRKAKAPGKAKATGRLRRHAGQQGVVPRCKHTYTGSLPVTRTRSLLPQSFLTSLAGCLLMPVVSSY